MGSWLFLCKGYYTAWGQGSETRRKKKIIWGPSIAKDWRVLALHERKPTFYYWTETHFKNLVEYSYFTNESQECLWLPHATQRVTERS